MKSQAWLEMLMNKLNKVEISVQMQTGLTTLVFCRCDCSDTELNIKVQCKGLKCTAQWKLQLLSSQLGDNILTHMPTLKEAVSWSAPLVPWWVLKATSRLQDVWEWTVTAVAHGFFSCSVDNAPSDVHRSVPLVLLFPHMRRHAQSILVLFGSTYRHSQWWSSTNPDTDPLSLMITS